MKTDSKVHSKGRTRQRVISYRPALSHVQYLPENTERQSEATSSSAGKSISLQGLKWGGYGQEDENFSCIGHASSKGKLKQHWHYYNHRSCKQLKKVEFSQMESLIFFSNALYLTTRCGIHSNLADFLIWKSQVNCVIKTWKHRDYFFT